MKPDWKDSPEWAKYLAQDQDGLWWWYESKPIISYDAWVPVDGDEFEEAELLYGDSWKETLQEKPIV